MSPRMVFASALFSLLAIGSVAGQQNQHSTGSVEQRNGAVPQNVKLPPLHLTDAEREQVAKLC